MSRHPNGGVTSPINIMYASQQVLATPVIRNGAPIVHKRKHNDVSPYGQTFSYVNPFDGKPRVGMLHAVPDPVTGGSWQHPQTGVVKAKMQEYWARPGETEGTIGHIFHWPVEADESEQCVGRNLSIGGRNFDLYEKEKGYRPATVEEVMKKLDEGDNNFKADMIRKQSADPAEQRRLLAEAIGDGVQKAMTGGFQYLKDNFKALELAKTAKA